MPCRYFKVVLLILIVTGRSLPGQTLQQTLIQVAPEKLIVEARERGDIVRGAILFSQGNIACVKCHRSTDQKDNIGPNLSRLGEEVTDASIVESILEPSKVINKEYQTINVVKVDGRIVSGMMISQDDDLIVLRDSGDVEKIITIKRNEVEELTPGSTSIMPDDLVDQLKDRQQFLDLLLYVLDLTQRSPNEIGAKGSSLARRELSPQLSGRVLIRQYNCIACHRDLGDEEFFPGPSAPDLKWSAKHLNPDHLANFIADPQLTKPGTNMPQMMPRLDQAERTKSATAIVAYLSSLDGNGFHQANAQPPERGDTKSGLDLFHSVGCIACHSPRDDKAVEQSPSDSIPMGELSGKYSLTALTEFLEDPHVARPTGRMPNMRLTHHEANDIASFLLSANADVPTIETQLTEALIEQGKSLFQTLNCGRCHAGIAEPNSAQLQTKSLAELNLDKGCLSSDASEKSPRFQLTDSEREQIRDAIRDSAVPLTDEQTIDLNLAHFNCTACHHRDNLGGVTQQRHAHFHTTNLNLGEQGRIPPTLTGVGAKLNAKWMRNVLVNGRSVRPYMKTRMPQYGEQNIGHLVDLFQSTDKLPKTKFAAFDDQKKTREQGLHLAGNKGLNCVACHTYQYKISDTMPAVDLTEMTERLKKDWFYQYMLSPQKFSPNTVMPSFWPNGKALRPDIVGTPADQVEALWQYLIDGRQARAPRGVIREPLEIVVVKEARMLRRSYPGIGKRGIGVGYPGGINLAFDAEQMRLAAVWKGKFVDPSGVWYGQGHGKVRMLGKAISLAAGPELDQSQNPWIVDDGRPPNHRFRGYVLDDNRRPTFRYTIGNVEVEDHFSEIEDQESKQFRLQRGIKLTAKQGGPQLRFRLLAGDAVKVSSDGKRVTGDRLQIHIISNYVAQIADGKEGTQAFISLPPAAYGAHELTLEYQWE